MPAVAQMVLNWMLIASLNINATFLTTDYLQNAYLITESNSLIKLDSTGNTLFNYNQNQFGKLKLVDATNPLKLILSYPEYGTVVMLDNTLSEIGLISLKPLGIYDYHALCFSPRDNNIWLFDENDFKLKKVNPGGVITFESTDMFQQLGFAIHPVFMQEENQYLYVSDTSVGILIFDVYGIYYETLPFKNVKEFQVRNDQVFFKQQDQLYSYQMKSLAEKFYALPNNKSGIIRVENNRLYLLKKDTVQIYIF